MRSVMMNDVTMPVMEAIDKMVSNIPGWSPIDQLFSLYSIVAASDVEGHVVEVGSWCGRSSCVLGMASMRCRGTKVYCIDLFPERSDWKRNEDGSYSLKVSLAGNDVLAYRDQTVWERPFEQDIEPIYERYRSAYDVFKESIENNGLKGIVIPFRGTLDMFLGQVDDGFDIKFAFIDGDHSYDSVLSDVENIERHLVPGGWICFDDAFSGYSGVDRAIREKIIDSDNYDFFQQMTRKFFVARRNRQAVEKLPDFRKINLNVSIR